MLILFSISSGFEFWSVSLTSICENSESKVFRNIKFLGEISSNSTNALLGARLLSLYDNRC